MWRDLQTRPAFIIRQRFVRVLTTCMLLTSLTSLSQLSQAEDPEYRISGITYSTEGSRWAVIEFPSGQQRLLREGASFEDFTLTSVDQYSVTFTVAGVSQTLSLRRGDADPDLDARSVQIADVDMNRARSALETLAKKSTFSPTELNQIFGLSPTDNIVWVNETQVETPTEALRALIASFENGQPYKLQMTSATQKDKLQELYLRAAEHSQPNGSITSERSSLDE